MSGFMLPGMEAFVPPRVEFDRVDGCPGCKRLTKSVGLFLPKANRIAVECMECGWAGSLDQDDYGHLFGLHRPQRRSQRRIARTDPDYTIFNRFGYRCVYCEASEEARQLRLQHLNALIARVDRGPTTLEFSDPTLRHAVLGSTTEAEWIAKNIFGLVVDHLIPWWVGDRLGEVLADLVDDCQNRWLVSACARCNEERKFKLEDPESLLFIYSRFVMPHDGANSLERVLAALRFAKALEVIERAGIRDRADQAV